MSNTIRRRTLAAASSVALLATSLASLSSAAAFQSGAVAIRIAGPSVTYEVSECPGADSAAEGHGVSFSTTRPDGSSISGNGVQIANGVFTLTTDIRSGSPDGAYQVSATCLDAASTAVVEYTPATFWVTDGSPSSEAPPTDPESSGDSPDDANDAPPTPTPADTDTPSTDSSNGTPTPSTDGDNDSSDTDPTSPDTDEDTSSPASAVQVDSATVSARDIFTAKVSDCLPSVEGAPAAVLFTVTDPAGNAKRVTAESPEAGGVFSASIRVPEKPVLGFYSVDAGCGVLEGQTFKAQRSYSQARFEVVPEARWESTTETEKDAGVSTQDPGTPSPAATTKATTPPSVRRDIPPQPEIAFTG